MPDPRDPTPCRAEKRGNLWVVVDADGKKVTGAGAYTDKAKADAEASRINSTWAEAKNTRRSKGGAAITEATVRFDANLHPRDRVGKFREVLGGLSVGHHATVKGPHGMVRVTRTNSGFKIRGGAAREMQVEHAGTAAEKAISGAGHGVPMERVRREPLRGVATRQPSASETVRDNEGARQLAIAAKKRAEKKQRRGEKLSEREQYDLTNPLAGGSKGEKNLTQLADEYAGAKVAHTLDPSAENAQRREEAHSALLSHRKRRDAMEPGTSEHVAATRELARKATPKVPWTKNRRDTESRAKERRHLGDDTDPRTPAGEKKGLDFFKTLTLAELRRRQDLTTQQIKMAHDQRNTDALERLQKTHDLLSAAVYHISFVKKKPGSKMSRRSGHDLLIEADTKADFPETMACPNGHKVPKGAKKCPTCGYSMKLHEAVEARKAAAASGDSVAFTSALAREQQLREELVLEERFRYPHVYHFDPRLHPRDRLGVFVQVLTSLKKDGRGSDMLLPHGISVTRKRTSFNVSVGGKRVGTHIGVEQAAAKALLHFDKGEGPHPFRPLDPTTSSRVSTLHPGRFGMAKLEDISPSDLAELERGDFSDRALARRVRSRRKRGLNLHRRGTMLPYEQKVSFSLTDGGPVRTGVVIGHGAAGLHYVRMPSGRTHGVPLKSIR